MLKASLPLLFGALLSLSAAPRLSAADTTLAFDPVHSTVGFKIRHLFSNVEGHFKKFTGEIQVDPDHPETASVSCSIETTTIDTGNAKRDEHLRTADFFDVVKFPAMTFKSKKVTVLGPDSATVVGDLTLHGVTKDVTLNVKLLGKGKGMKGSLTSGWEATTRIKRSEFGLVWGKVVEGTDLVGDDVDIDLQIAADEQAK